MKSRPLARPLLRPLVPVYGGVIAAKGWLLEHGVLSQRRLGHPVISVGSLSAGGAGKTPVVAMLAELLIGRGYEVRILTRGYGRRSRTVQRVEPGGAASQFGDEPLMLARCLPEAAVWVGRDRYSAGMLSERDETAGTKVVYLLDDGFQHRKLARDVDVVLLTRRELEDALLPEGNLREPLKAIGRADVIVLREEDGFAGGISGKAATWFVRRELHFAEGEGRPLRPVAFCGLARPEGFFAMLAGAGVSVAGARAFRDHHGYSSGDIEGLVRLARECGADGFVTTEKDAVKLTGEMMEGLGSVGRVAVAELSLELAEEESCIERLLDLIASEVASPHCISARSE